MAIESINPATGEKIRSYEALSLEEILKKLEKAQSAFQDWKNLRFNRRATRSTDRLGGASLKGASPSLIAPVSHLGGFKWYPSGIPSHFLSLPTQVFPLQTKELR